MTDEQFAFYSAYIKTLAEHLLVADWEIELLRDTPSSPQAWASVQIAPSQNYAGIRVAFPAFFQQSPDDQRLYLVHELMHIHLERMRHLVNDLATESDDQAVRFAAKLYNNQNEISNHNLARVFAPILPLPIRAIS